MVVVYVCAGHCLPCSPDLVWVLSFSHRASGFVLTAGISAAAITYLASGTPFPEAVKSLEGFASSHPYLWTDCKFLMALPLTYHLFNGIRHLVSACSPSGAQAALGEGGRTDASLVPRHVEGEKETPFAPGNELDRCLLGIEFIIIV